LRVLFERPGARSLSNLDRMRLLRCSYSAHRGKFQLRNTPMGRPAKVTKHSLVIALSRSPSITQAARYLGVDRHTVYDTAKRFGVDLSTELMRFSTPFPTSEAQDLPSTLPEQPPAVEQGARPEGDIRRFRMADYTGPYRGDTGGRRKTALLDRYERLKRM